MGGTETLGMNVLVTEGVFVLEPVLHPGLRQVENQAVSPPENQAVSLKSRWDPCRVRLGLGSSSRNLRKGPRLLGGLERLRHWLQAAVNHSVLRSWEEPVLPESPGQGQGHLQQSDLSHHTPDNSHCLKRSI